MDVSVHTEQAEQEEKLPGVGVATVMLYIIIGYVLVALGTFSWLSYNNWSFCNGLEDCLLTLGENVALGGVWPIYWGQQFF